MNILKEERKKDADKIAELERRLRRERTNSRDNATQSSEESGRVNNAQEETWRRTLRESGDEMKILQFEENYPPKEGCDHYHPQWIPTDLYEWHPKPLKSTTDMDPQW